MSNLIDNKPPPKKRGRKPKGGKIISKTEKNISSSNIISNIILHLKCKKSDLNECFSTNIQYNPSVPSIEGTTNNYYKPSELSYQVINNKNDIKDNNNDCENIKIHKPFTKKSEEICNDHTCGKEEKIITKDIYNKVKQIQYSLHTNNLANKKSDCFWCTYSFDNPTIYIPKGYIKNKYQVYGNFCSPECAVAFLFNEHIDSSTKFERYNLFNHIYSKIYNYEKNIKPAPNPHYLLDKFLGNLSITEYRKLSSQEQLLFIMDKPITRVYPELHDNKDDFLMNETKKSSSNLLS